jgi:F-type H+-transporting ATPase subunit epsilon
MSTFNLSILAPERILLDDEAAESLTITTGEGDMISTLETGRFIYRDSKGQNVVGVISSGFLNVENGTVKVIAETIELAGEIDKNRAKQAQMKAEKMLTEASLDEHSFKKYQLKLQRSIIRQSLGN